LVIVVDTSVWINKFRGIQTAAVQMLSKIDDGATILVGDVVLLELLQGARSEAQAQKIERSMRAFAFDQMLDRRLAVAAARNFRALRGLGFTIRTSVDLIIGTYCIEHGHLLLQDDRDFAPMAKHLGLQLV
jgi:predicted nucleic acid-binding protein